MTISEKLVADIRTFISRTGYTATQMGVEFAGSGSFINDILHGRKSPKVSKADALYVWMAERDPPKRRREK